MCGSKRSTGLMMAVLGLLLFASTSLAQEQRPMPGPHYKQRQYSPYSHDYDEHRQPYGGYLQPQYPDDPPKRYLQPLTPDKEAYSDPYSSPYGKEPEPHDSYSSPHDSYSSPYKPHEDDYPYAGSGYEYAPKNSKPVSGNITWHVDRCTVRYSGIANDTTGTLQAGVSRPSTVVGWWKLSCDVRLPLGEAAEAASTAGANKQDSLSKLLQAAKLQSHPYGGYGSSNHNGNDNSTAGGGAGGGSGSGSVTANLDNAGDCWFSGITDAGIKYKQGTDNSLSASITVTCKLDPDRAKLCGLVAVTGNDVYLGAQGRVTVSYTGGTPGVFAIKNTPNTQLLVTGLYEGQAQTPSYGAELPARFQVGTALVDIKNCANANVDETKPLEDPAASGSGTFITALTV